MNRDELFAWIDAYLEVRRFGDYSPIGLQVEGAAAVQRVALGVSAHLEIIEAAAAWGAQVLLVHHGFFWPGEPLTLRGWRKARIKALLVHDLSLGSYHLPLDAHPVVGNNARLCDLLGVPAQGRAPFARSKGADIGLIGRFDAPVPASALFGRLKAGLGGAGLVFDAGPAEVSVIGVVSGGGASYYEEARALGAQLFVTGEPREPAMAEARETGTHFVAAGHYNTETLGIKALGAQIEAALGLETRFFDFPNPV
jgi:dinuclear metal center YbgI/SA1388 family protein